MLYKNKRELIQARKHNARLYPIYKMCSWDLLFYYAIAFIFLVQVKGFSASQVMFTDALFPLFKIVLDIPCTMIIERIGKKKSLVIANLFLSIYIVLLLISKSIVGLVGAYFIMAFAFCIKGIAESNLLYDSVTQRKGKGMFSKLEELGARNYYFLDGISSILTGFLFIVNGYLPILISLAFTIIAIFLSLRFREVIEVKKDIEKNLKYKILNYKDELKCAFKFIFKSRRLKALMLFIGIFDGLVYTSYTLRETLLNELIAPQYFAVVIAVLTIVSGMFSSLQDKLNSKFKNKTFMFIASIYVPTFIIIGALLKINIPYVLLLVLLLALYFVQYAMQSPYHILSSKYTKSFASSQMRNKISSAFDLIKHISQFLIALLASIMLDLESIENNFLIIGGAFIIIIILVLWYMRKRVGLDPNKYSKTDIEVLNPKD